MIVCVQKIWTELAVAFKSPIQELFLVGGIGNRREELNQNSLGIPVIAIGVPTVTMFPNDTEFIVTPKEIDKLIKDMSEIISDAINMSL